MQVSLLCWCIFFKYNFVIYFLARSNLLDLSNLSTPDILLFLLKSWFDGTPAGEKVNEIFTAFDASIPKPVSPRGKFPSTQMNFDRTTHFHSRGSSLTTTPRRPNLRLLSYTQP